MLSAAEMSTPYASGRPPLKSVKVCIFPWFHPYSASGVSLIASMSFTCHRRHTLITAYCPKLPDAAALMHVIYTSSTTRAHASKNVHAGYSVAAVRHDCERCRGRSAPAGRVEGSGGFQRQRLRGSAAGALHRRPASLLDNQVIWRLMNAASDAGLSQSGCSRDPPHVAFSSV